MAEKEYNVIVSDAALAMLDSHIDFLAKVSKNAAVKMMDKILCDMNSLSKNPQRFPAYESPFLTDVCYRRMFSAKRYLIFYEISGDTVYVDYIVDCRQDYEWLIL